MLGHRQRIVAQSGRNSLRVLDDRGHAELVHEGRHLRPTDAAVCPERGQVSRLRQRRAQRDVALVLRVPIVEGVPADDANLIVEQGRRRDQARLQRRAVRIHLE